MNYNPKFSIMEEYETPVCEMISDVEVNVLCESTGEKFDQATEWDGQNSWN